MLILDYIILSNWKHLEGVLDTNNRLFLGQKIKKSITWLLIDFLSVFVYKCLKVQILVSFENLNWVPTT